MESRTKNLWYLRRQGLRMYFWLFIYHKVRFTNRPLLLSKSKASFTGGLLPIPHQAIDNFTCAMAIINLDRMGDMLLQRQSILRRARWRSEVSLGLRRVIYNDVWSSPEAESEMAPHDTAHGTRSPGPHLYLRGQGWPGWPPPPSLFTSSTAHRITSSYLTNMPLNNQSQEKGIHHRLPQLTHLLTGVASNCHNANACS